MSTDKKVAFITGGNRGIGLQTALDLGKQGVVVVIGARQPERATDALAQLRQAGVEAEVIAYDAARPETDQGVFAYLDKRWGRLDILVNNAGESREDPFAGPNAATVPEGVLRGTFETNFFAVVRLTQALLPLLRRSAAGRIVNVSSILGSLTLHSDPKSPIASAKALAYNASKTALNAFTIHLASQLADTPIKVNSAHPGWVKTALGGEQAPVEVADGARTSVGLALLDAQGPTGGFFYEGNPLPW